MLKSDEISERLTNRLIRKKSAEWDEIERYQQNVKKMVVYLRNFIIVLIIMIAIMILCLLIL